MRHVRNQRKTTALLEKGLIRLRAAPRAECEDNVLEIVHVDVVAHKHETVDRVPNFVGEHQITNRPP